MQTLEKNNRQKDSWVGSSVSSILKKGTKAGSLGIDGCFGSVVLPLTQYFPVYFSLFCFFGLLLLLLLVGTNQAKVAHLPFVKIILLLLQLHLYYYDNFCSCCCCFIYFVFIIFSTKNDFFFEKNFCHIVECFVVTFFVEKNFQKNNIV